MTDTTQKESRWKGTKMKINVGDTVRVLDTGTMRSFGHTGKVFEVHQTFKSHEESDSYPIRGETESGNFMFLMSRNVEIV